MVRTRSQCKLSEDNLKRSASDYDELPAPKRKNRKVTEFVVKTETAIFYPFYGNIMTCHSFFNMEGLMTKYGITGKNITQHIFSFLDYDAMVASRMVSKTWYQFLENEKGLWIKQMKKYFKVIYLQKNY